MKTCLRIHATLVLLLCGRVVIAQGPSGQPISGGYSVGVNDPAMVAVAEAKSRQYSVLVRQGKEAIKKNEVAKGVKLLELAAVTFLMDEPRTILANIYLREGKIDDVLRILHPVIYPAQFGQTNAGHTAPTRMLYILALLDRGKWREAVDVYKESFAAEQVAVNNSALNGALKWALPGNIGPAHTIPEVHFSGDSADYAGLETQAHLILGACEPMFVSFEDKPQYMLDHLKQSIKYDPYSPDAHFISGILVDSMGKFPEARSEFKRAAKLATVEAQPEIKKALSDLDEHEQRKKERDAIEAARKAHKIGD